MRIADARQQGGHPTHPEHIFTYEATVQNGQVVLFHRTGSYPYTFCPAACQIVQGILTYNGAPEDGTYIFQIHRQEKISATFRAEGGEEQAYQATGLWALARHARLEDIRHLDTGLRYVSMDANQELVRDCVRAVWLHHFLDNPSAEADIPAHEELQFIAHTAESIQALIDEKPELNARLKALSSYFGMVIDGKQVHIYYRERYYTWELVMVQWMINYLRENLEEAYRAVALHNLGTTVATMERLKRTEAHLRQLLGDVDEESITEAVVQGEREYLELFEARQSPRTPRVRFSLF